MKSSRKELWFNIPTRCGFVNITLQVEACPKESGIQDGIALVNPMHITASIFIDEDESGLHHDYEEWLEGLAPHEPVGKYWYNRTGEDNADAHLKRQIEFLTRKTGLSARARQVRAACLWRTLGGQ